MLVIHVTNWHDDTAAAFLLHRIRYYAPDSASLTQPAAHQISIEQIVALGCDEIWRDAQ